MEPLKRVALSGLSIQGSVLFYIADQTFIYKNKKILPKFCAAIYIGKFASSKIEAPLYRDRMILNIYAKFQRPT